jgi:hypothetical protein
MFGKTDDVFFCRLETLNEELVTFFGQIGAGNTELRDHVLGSTKVNASQHFHYSTYYTPQLADSILIRDRPLIEKFGYVFEEPRSTTENCSFSSSHVM